MPQSPPLLATALTSRPGLRFQKSPCCRFACLKCTQPRRSNQRIPQEGSRHHHHHQYHHHHHHHHQYHHHHHHHLQEEHYQSTLRLWMNWFFPKLTVLETAAHSSEYNWIGHNSTQALQHGPCSNLCGIPGCLALTFSEMLGWIHKCTIGSLLHCINEIRMEYQWNM